MTAQRGWAFLRWWMREQGWLVPGVGPVTPALAHLRLVLHRYGAPGRGESTQDLTGPAELLSTLVLVGMGVVACGDTLGDVWLTHSGVRLRDALDSVSLDTVDLSWLEVW